MTADDLHHDLNKVIHFLQQEHPPQPPPEQPKKQNPSPFSDTGFPLDPNQTLAATHLYGPLRVMAPAGSGKTRTLVSRITFLLQQGIPPERILALAFNRKAQQEMQDRLAALGHTVNVRTFHSFGYEIVRHGLGWEYHENSHIRWMELYHACLSRHLPGEQIQSLEAYLALQRRATMELAPLKNLTLPSPYQNRPFQPIFEDLLAAQIAHQLLTFDGMIYFALRVLLANPALRHSLQHQYEFVLVDEFQDLNQAQMLLTRLIALPQNNLFVVGDDDQTIYGWRGADVRLILDFPQIYPDAQTVILATNYRSTRKIVRHARMLIEHNPERVAKDIQPRPGAGVGTLDVLLTTGIRQQAKAALDWIESQKETHALSWDAFAILYRTNSSIYPVIPLLEQRNIPYTLAKDTGEASPEADSPPDIQPNAITLLTIHKSKGKEFPFVVYFNFVQSAAGYHETTLPEERRVAYVGATRAQQGLLLTADEDRYSPFLRELTLNPAFANYAIPYLERQTEIARRKHTQLTRKIHTLPHQETGRWFSWWPWKTSHPAKDKRQKQVETLTTQLDEIAERLDILETEIRFRKLFAPKQKA
ncbi:MAG: hypothetical protein Fur0022_02770 [Anaerolineales bacterium]